MKLLKIQPLQMQRLPIQLRQMRHRQILRKRKNENNIVRNAERTRFYLLNTRIERMAKRKNKNKNNRSASEALNRGEKYFYYSHKVRALAVVFEYISRRQFIVVKKIIEKKKFKPIN